MFELLSRVLLWLLIGTIVFSLFQKFYPSGNFVGRFVVVIFLVVLLLSFVNPSEPAIAQLWSVVSFPLKPLGAAILLMTFAAQRIKGGAIDKPGGFLVGWALTILLLASTPAFTYFLLQSPANEELASPRQGLQLVDFVPSATALQRTTRVWESYLNQVNQFLRPR
ncbi:MAG: hypothetical protein WBF90_36105 [Rivularia sp. (in: cyanobacteria)]|jgi:hypothetical protein